MPTANATTKQPLTTRQRLVLETIVRFWGLTGRTPTYRELMIHTGIRSLNGVVMHLRVLERKGHLRLIRKGVSGSVVGITVVGLTDRVARMADEFVASLDGYAMTTPHGGNRSRAKPVPITLETVAL